MDKLSLLELLEFIKESIELIEQRFASVSRMDDLS